MAVVKNYYKTLGIPHHASTDEIKSAYRSLAKIYHPDKNNNSKVSEEQFKEVLEAYRVLANEEQRKKYDLKLRYGLSYTYVSKSQQANRDAYKKYGRRYAGPPPHSTSRWPSGSGQAAPPEKPQHFFERFKITLSFIATVFILYLISHYSEEANSPKLTMPAPGKPLVKDEPALVLIQNADSPYDTVFGKAVSDPDAKNLISIINHSAFEAVVCLAILKPNHEKIIRNEYLSQGTRYSINHIPDGNYYLKIYFGKSWNPGKHMARGIRGGFDESSSFVRSKKGTIPFKIKQIVNGENILFSSYEIKIDPHNPDFEPISEEEYFKTVPTR